MVDNLTQAKRSWNMSRVRNRDTKPELMVRSLLHRSGFRFRLHEKGLSGRPDIVLPKYRTVVFVHGCFWHRHKGCPDATTPKTKTAFWKRKFQGNTARDLRTAEDLRSSGWKIIIVWECETCKADKLLKRLKANINPSSNKASKVTAR